MYIEATYPLPIFSSGEKWYASSCLIQGTDDYVGVLWSEMNTQTMKTHLTFFQIHLLTGNISQRFTSWPVFADFPQLYYDYGRQTWIACLPFRTSIPHTGREIVLYEIRMEQEQWLVLPHGVTGATVVVQEESPKHTFWLVEEYKDRVKVSLHESETGVERTNIWLEGISLPEGPVHAGEASKLMGVMAYGETLLIVGANQHQQLHVFQIRL